MQRLVFKIAPKQMPAKGWRIGSQRQALAFVAVAKWKTISLVHWLMALDLSWPEANDAGIGTTAKFPLSDRCANRRVRIFRTVISTDSSFSRSALSNVLLR